MYGSTIKRQVTGFKRAQDFSGRFSQEDTQTAHVHTRGAQHRQSSGKFTSKPHPDTASPARARPADRRWQAEGVQKQEPCVLVAGLQKGTGAMENNRKTPQLLLKNVNIAAPRPPEISPLRELKT